MVVQDHNQMLLEGRACMILHSRGVVRLHTFYQHDHDNDNENDNVHDIGAMLSLVTKVGISYQSHALLTDIGRLSSFKLQEGLLASLRLEIK